MRKTDLKAYVERLVDEKTKSIDMDIYNKTKQVREKVVNDFLSQPHLKHIAESAENLAQYVEDNLEKTPISDYAVSRLRIEFADMQPRTVSEFNSLLRQALTGEGSVKYKIYGVDYRDELVKLANDIKPLKTEISKLKTLRNELINIITVSRNAKDAYKSLAAAGLDMTGFEEPTNYLPAVVKLSVDPSILAQGGEKNA